MRGTADERTSTPEAAHTGGVRDSLAVALLFGAGAVGLGLAAQNLLGTPITDRDILPATVVFLCPVVARWRQQRRLRKPPEA